MLTEGGERDGVRGDGSEAEATRNSRGELGEEAEERESGRAGG